MRRRLGELMVAAGAISPLELADALDEQREAERLGDTVIRLGLVDDETLARAISQQLGIDLCDADALSAPEHDVVAMIPKHFATTRQVLPLRQRGDHLVVAMSDPTNLVIVDDLRTMTGAREVTTLVATSRDIRQAVDVTYHGRVTPVDDFDLEDLMDVLREVPEADDYGDH